MQLNTQGLWVGAVHLRIADGIASVTFDRPEQRNAMTWAMYEQLEGVCRQLHEDESVRAVRFQGAGGKAFVSGTDIPQFQAFKTGDSVVGTTAAACRPLLILPGKRIACASACGKSASTTSTAASAPATG